MKVLLLGGTGFLGREVGRRLIEAGHQVRVLVRSEARAAGYYGRANVVVGDILDPAAMVRACAGAEVAIDLVAVRRNRPQSLLAVNIDGPKTLAWAAKQTNLKGIIFVSVVGARLEPKFRYLSSRWMGEDQLRQSGVPTAILRFAPIIGEGGGLLGDFERLTRMPGPLMMVPGRGATRMQPILLEDAARCVLETLNHPELAGQTLDIGGPEVVTYDQLFEAYCRARSVSRRTAHVPVAALSPGATVMELVMRDPLVVPDELHTLQIESVAGRFDIVPSVFGFSASSPLAWIAAHAKPALSRAAAPSQPARS